MRKRWEVKDWSSPPSFPKSLPQLYAPCPLIYYHSFNLMVLHFFYFHFIIIVSFPLLLLSTGLKKNVDWTGANPVQTSSSISPKRGDTQVQTQRQKIKLKTYSSLSLCHHQFILYISEKERNQMPYKMVENKERQVEMLTLSLCSAG